jgi:hypothetical protein
MKPLKLNQISKKPNPKNRKSLILMVQCSSFLSHQDIYKIEKEEQQKVKLSKFSPESERGFEFSRTS